MKIWNKYKIGVLDTMTNDIRDKIQRITDQLDEVAIQYEQKWGANILYNLVTVSIFLITHFLTYNDIVKKTER